MSLAPKDTQVNTNTIRCFGACKHWDKRRGRREEWGGVGRRIDVNVTTRTTAGCPKNSYAAVSACVCTPYMRDCIDYAGVRVRRYVRSLKDNNKGLKERSWNNMHARRRVLAFQWHLLQPIRYQRQLRDLLHDVGWHLPAWVN